MQFKVPAAENLNGKGMYKKVQSWKYSVTRIQTVSVLALILVFISACFSFTNVINENSVLFDQLHGLPLVSDDIPPPTRYWTMDWIMAPMRVYSATGPTWVQTVVARNMCLDDEGACNPLSWQLDTACVKNPSPINGSDLFVPIDVVNEQSYFYKNTKTKFRRLQPLFTCMSEKIGLVNLIVNNQHSYSIGSTHSVHVLATGVFVILCIILFSMLLGAVDTKEKPDHDNRQRRIFIGLFVLTYVLISYYVSDDQAVNNDQDQHRAIALASYAYTTFYIVMALLIFNQNSVFDDHKRETTRIQQEKIDKKVGSQQQNPSGVMLAYPNGHEAMEETKSAQSMATRPVTLSVKGFVREPWHFDDRIKNTWFERPACCPVSSQVDLNICEYISIPVHSKFVYAQFLTLPLIVLAFYMHSRNFGIDSQSQLIFVCAWIFALVDLFLYRMWWAFQIHKGVTFYSPEDKSEYRAMAFITLVGILFQVAVCLVLLLSNLFTTSYVVVISLYLIFGILLKVGIVVSIIKNLDYNGETMDMFQKSRVEKKFEKFVGIFQKVDYTVFVGYVLVVTITLWVCIINDHDRFFQPEWMKATKMTDRWGSGWQVFHSLM